MKKLLAFLLCAALLLGLTACGNSGNTLLEGIDPETSAIALWVWDGGETVTQQWLYGDEEQAFLDEIGSLKAKKLDSCDTGEFSPTVYAVSGFTGEDDIYGLWCDGVWVTSDGEAYELDADFSGYLTEYEWEDVDALSLSTFPGIYSLATDGETWNPTFLSQADEPEPTSATLTIDEIEGDTVTTTFLNTGEETWTYDYYYSLEVQLEGQWYTVPAQTDYATIDLAGELPPQERAQMRYDLSFFGDVPDGDYRLVASGCCAALTRADGAWTAGA